MHPRTLAPPHPRTVFALVGIAALWIGVAAGAHFYVGYDWRYMTLSRLLAPDHNPAGHTYASLGIVVCALCELIWATDALRCESRVPRSAARPTTAGLTAMQLGMAGMILAAIPANWLLDIPKGHEALATVAFAGLGFGMLHVGFCTVEGTLAGSARGSGRPRFFALLLATAAMTPIVFAGLTQAYVFYAHPELPWVGASWRERGIPAYVSLAFWEWITCAVFSIYMFVIALLTRPAATRPSRA